MSTTELEPRDVTHTVPTDGVPDVADTSLAAEADLTRLRAGAGPIAVDAERASGYRYSQRAYLLQFAREGSGIALLDPAADVDLGAYAQFVNGLPWILHAATQDLPCLREAGFRPSDVFDTELAARLLGRPKVGLAALLEQELDVVLAKEHSAVDWSQRPLPHEWLAYAALDVEFLAPLHERLLADLEERGRRAWYDEERALLLSFTGPAPREEPWRRVSGIHAIRDPRRLAVVRALWEARDLRARDLDVSPGRLLHDSIIVDVAKHLPASQRLMEGLRPVHNRNVRKDPVYWWQAVEAALALDDAALPQRQAGGGALPPPRAWAQRNPDAAARWDVVRPVVVACAEDLGIAPEVLVQPDIIRTLCWNGCAADLVGQTLSDMGARTWQVAQVEPRIVAALTAGD